MTISYNWLSEYLPETIEVEKLSKILTSIGLEVESVEKFESIKGGLEGLIIGEVVQCEQHPNADKLKITQVNIGAVELLQIVCGAANVAVNQKVVVAKVGSTIYPIGGEPLTMKVAKIRGIESFGMICAEDEIGLSNNHAGILVLPDSVKVGSSASNYFKPYSDIIFEIGLTPNRMDAMSHLGVAKDVCAYLTHHNKKDTKTKLPFNNSFKPDSNNVVVNVLVENTDACLRYSGVTITNLTIKESPEWLKNKLAAIGVRSINNVVDVTNFILHETGQPLHAFDLQAVKGNNVIVKNAETGDKFVTLDEKERKLSNEDLMICNGDGIPMCIGGVFGGLQSGISKSTVNIFLESACFNPISIRKTSIRHGLRTDAAARFEKGVDISNTVNILKRAALLIKEVAGGEIASDIVDIYPLPKEKTQFSIKYHYIKKLSGKNYHPDAVKRILVALGFEIMKEGIDELFIAVPFSKPDISLPADIVEEIIRIDGLDNIDIPSTITITPSAENLAFKEVIKEKIANYLVGQGFHEIFTNSITNSRYYDEAILQSTVKMINNLSEELNVMRPSMLETGLETIAYNSNRKNTNLHLFEFGKTYATTGVGAYQETEHIALYFTGNNHEDIWNEKSKAVNFYTVKGFATAILQLVGINGIEIIANETQTLFTIQFNQKKIGTIHTVTPKMLNNFGIKQPVYFIDILFETIIAAVEKNKIVYKEVSKFPSVERDLAIVVNKSISYNHIQSIIQQQKINKLQQVRLFDVFESDKLGAAKKSIAMNFTFLDEEKTLTDKEIDAIMQKLINGFTSALQAEVRK
jgi:phenylalanyl-tRNA synthetase beta chain